MTDNPKQSDTEAPKPDSWDPLIAAHHNFMNELACCHEMFKLVSPALKSEDEKRDKKIEQFAADLENTKKLKPAALLNEISEFSKTIRKLRTADRTFRQTTIVSIVSKFDEFVMVLLRRAFDENPDWLKNADKSVTYVQLLEIDSIQEFVADLIRKEVDQLMRGSHHKQIALLDSKLKIGIEDNFCHWKDFLEITERRNLFVHSGGVVNTIYLENAKRFGFEETEEKLLGASDEYVSHAIDIFYELSVRLLQGVCRRLYPECYAEVDLRLNNDGVELLAEERWELAERIFEYAIGIPKKMRTDDEFNYLFIINLCIAKKSLGKEINTSIKSVNWKPLHPKYQFAVALLQDRNADAAKLMCSEAVREQVDKNHLLTWPLLRDFRKTDVFASSFHEIYGYPFEQELLEKTKESFVNESERIPEQFNENEMVEKYPFTYASLNEQLSNRYVDFRINSKYHAIRKPLLCDRRFVIERVQNDDDEGSPKPHYSKTVFHIFDKYYTLRSANNGG